MSAAEEQSILIVGASAAGLATAEALRREGHRGAMTLIDAESHPPYDRPPLSKQVLSGEWSPERAHLRSAELLAALDATFVLADRAERLDLSTRAVTTSSGREFRADAVVLATGVAARRLPGQASVPGTHVLRSLDDAVRLKGALRPGRRLVVVGNGVLGSEIAATAAHAGLDVTLVGSDEHPMQRQLGPLGSTKLAELHEDVGIRMLGGRRVVGLVGRSASRSAAVCVNLGTGEGLEADDVVVAIGADPVTGWLVGSGLTLDDGIVCDATCAAAPGVWAVGDVARWDHPLLGSLRLENRTNATEQAIAVARNVLGAQAAYAPVPYFWTDQHGVKIMVHGTIPPGARLTVTDGDPEEGRFVATATGPHDDTVGVLGWGMPKQTRIRTEALRAAVAASA